MKKYALKGEKHPLAKLNKKIIDKMCNMYETGQYTYNDISILFDNIVTSETVDKIIRNERWLRPRERRIKNRFSGLGERNFNVKLTKKRCNKY